MVEINLMLGGDMPKNFPKNENWAGVDKGASYLLKNNIYPIYSFGDFDSINIEDKKTLAKKSKIFIKESQNEVDLEFALDKLLNLINVEKINIYGATGARLDHFLGNIMLLRNEKYKNVRIDVIDDNNIITISRAGENVFRKKENYKYFSVVPLESATTMTICGAKYDAENLLLTTTRPNATSNEFLKDEITLIVDKDVLVIYSKD